MSFQAYLDNIKAKPVKTPGQMKEAVEKEVDRARIKINTITPYPRTCLKSITLGVLASTAPL
jgi:hypothetical protein